MFAFSAISLGLAAFFLNRVTRGEAHIDQTDPVLDLSGDTAEATEAS
jgi:hypothetical protein